MKQWGEMNKMMGRMRTMANQAQAGGKKGKKGKKMRMPNIPGLDAMGWAAVGGLGNGRPQVRIWSCCARWKRRCATRK